MQNSHLLWAGAQKRHQPSSQSTFIYQLFSKEAGGAKLWPYTDLILFLKGGTLNLATLLNALGSVWVLESAALNTSSGFELSAWVREVFTQLLAMVILSQSLNTLTAFSHVHLSKKPHLHGKVLMVRAVLGSYSLNSSDGGSFWSVVDF